MKLRDKDSFPREADSAISSHSVSYKDKVLHGSNAENDQEWIQMAEIEVEEGDIVVEQSEESPMIEISEMFKGRLQKALETSVIVKLLRCSIG